jgi:hypothetical protein
MFKHGADKRKRTVAPKFVRTGHYDTRSYRREHKTVGEHRGLHGSWAQLVSFPLPRGLLEKRQIKKMDSKKKLKEKVKHSGKIFNERDAL